MRTFRVQVETAQDLAALRRLAARRGLKLQEIARRGPGRPPALDEEIRAEIIARSRAGEFLSAIARDLDSRGVPTAQGGRWRASTVRKIVRTADAANS